MTEMAVLRLSLCQISQKGRDAGGIAASDPIMPLLTMGGRFI